MDHIGRNHVMAAAGCPFEIRAYRAIWKGRIADVDQVSSGSIDFLRIIPAWMALFEAMNRSWLAVAAVPLYVTAEPDVFISGEKRFTIHLPNGQGRLNVFPVEFKQLMYTDVSDPHALWRV